MRDQRVTQSDVTVERNRAYGSYTCSAILPNGYRFHMQYYGHTKKDAVRLFVRDANEQYKNWDR